MQEKVNVFWYRRDLRLHDNVGLFHALQEDEATLPVFIFDKYILDELPEDDARVSFIFSEIQKMRNELQEKYGSSIATYYGYPEEVFKEITQDFIDLVKKYTNKDIIINLDNNKDGMSKLNEYVDIYKSCKFFIMPDKYNTYKDLNDLVVNRCINKTEMYKFVLNNSYIREKTKMMLTWRK